MSDEETVIVEGSMGPEKGYYHQEDEGTWLGGKPMDREEAEDLGYSPCSSCFGGADG